MNDVAHLSIVTGASRGMGRAIAERLAREHGHRVLGLSRRAPPAPAGIEQWACDLGDPLPVAERLVGWLGGFAADAFDSVNLVNNAALLTDPAPLWDTDLGQLSQSARVGLEAPLLLTAAFLRATRGWRGARRVLHISSGLGRRGMASAGPYCAVKAGLDNLARAQALEEAHQPNGARVCSLAPGVIDTDMQVQLRAADAGAFPDVEMFRNMKRGNVLDTPADAAAKVVAFLLRPDFGKEPVADVRG
jgi:NAD(P)-dependent dehydrogenase (short-subunit alcohol dehydrogenase family)